ncbi:hypothetical protein F4778DRAFT_659790 [Xylariomycetidae sp. FL2044]|nr:hypothetical protein F4778DRAFT_659790 [Xylariomycetidae sp. FL2044]
MRSGLEVSSSHVFDQGTGYTASAVSTFYTLMGIRGNCKEENIKEVSVPLSAPSTYSKSKTARARPNLQPPGPASIPVVWNVGMSPMTSPRTSSLPPLSGSTGLLCKVFDALNSPNMKIARLPRFLVLSYIHPLSFSAPNRTSQVGGAKFVPMRMELWKCGRKSSLVSRVSQKLVPCDDWHTTKSLVDISRHSLSMDMIIATMARFSMYCMHFTVLFLDTIQRIRLLR